MSKFEPGLSISAVVARTGVSAAVLRSWERRYGFPTPGRQAGGHRRYAESDLEQIERMLRERAAGRSLERAIELARQPVGVDSSIFAGLRRLRPDLPVHSLSRRSMLAISRAIEDECCAQADAPVLVAAFQREDVYRRAEPRWQDLARTARAAVVFADFRETHARDDGPDELALPADSPLSREWSVICDAPGSAACLAGWERPVEVGRSVRRFEALWSVEPAVVRHASRLAVELARRHGPDLAIASVELTADPLAAEPTETLRRAAAITNRVVAFLDGPLP